MSADKSFRPGAMIACSMLVATVSGFAYAAESAIRHRFICIDNGANPNRLIHVDQRDPSADWVVDIPGPKSRDLQLVGGDRVLVSHASGAAEYSLADGKEVWSVKGYKRIYTARRLRNGNTLLGENTPEGTKVYEVDPAGKQVRSRIVHRSSGGLRVMRRLPSGNLLLNLIKPNRAVEIDPAGRVVWQVDLTPFGKGYKVVRLYNGHTLASTGDGCKVVQFDQAGKVVRFFGESVKGEHPRWRLDFFSGFDLTMSGNVVAANWLGHGKAGAGPHLVEFDRANKLIWQWEDHKLAKAVTNVMMLDNYARPLAGNAEKALGSALLLGRARKAILPPTTQFGPLRLADAYAVQDRYTLAMTEVRGPVVGHKVGMLSIPTSLEMGKKAPVGGRLFAGQRVETGGTVWFGDCILPRVEVEIAFTIDKRIDRPIEGVEQLKPLIRSLHAAIDIHDRGLARAGRPVMAADVVAIGCGACRFVLGPAVAPKGLDLTKIQLRLKHDEKVVREGVGSAVMGDPYRAVLWQINHLVGRGFAIEAGEVILSGSPAPSYGVRGEQATGIYVGECGSLGTVRFKCDPRPSPR